ncbi:hypothetical protein DFH07DRAFT_811654 [Mycena maculata]|uniref:Zn(2)-C6 fungal-type domain-containing protein n=1 Tax=Mycena maculata TaxID=230809 RepID=A0AAD7NKD6_9AGAR|nr:hypothetical protein DFH07DRAFT_811654 [Mycena maculata]
MKRASGPANENPAAKRTKASQACASCRRQKSRCEILDVRSQHGAQVTIRCHRCKVLGIECSFETSDLIHFLPKPTTPASSPTLTGSSDAQTPPESYGGLSTLAAVASSRPNAEAINVNSVPSRYGMLPEDLVPTAHTPIWGCVNRIDWTATPMLAIQELVRCPKTDAGLDLPSGGRLADVLSPQEITSLLEIFETRYSPWICAQPGPLECTNSLLDIVRCTVASRHLAPPARSVIAPRLQKLTEEVFIREIFNPQPPLESIKALLILSVWAPICGTGAEARDGRLLIASAVSMAMNLHLQGESKRSMDLRAEMDKLSPAQLTELDESTDKWRLWMYLSTSESMLCMGTGRTPVSHISQLDHDMTNTIAPHKFTSSFFRDVRLGLSAKMFNFAEKAILLRLRSAKDLGPFFAKINSIMYSMEGLGRLLTPLPVVSQFDTFYCQMLILQYHACRLLMMHHALRETRTVHERETPHQPWYEVETGGFCVSLFFGRIALISAEAVLTAFLTPTDLTLLSTAPDNFYVMVAFAATWIFVSNFSIHKLGGGKLGGASEMLQTMVIARLNEIAHSPDHAAARSGYVLGALLRAWERRKPFPPEDSEACVCIFQMPYENLRPPPPPANATSHADYLNQPNWQDLGGLIDGPRDVPANSDLFMDDEFWAVFIENLQSSNADTFIAQNSGVQ